MLKSIEGSAGDLAVTFSTQRKICMMVSSIHQCTFLILKVLIFQRNTNRRASPIHLGADLLTIPIYPPLSLPHGS